MEYDEIFDNVSADDFTTKIDNFIDNCWSSVLKNNELTTELKEQLPYFIDKINDKILKYNFNPRFFGGYLSFLNYFKKVNFTNNTKMWKNWIAFRYVELN
jgi:hypothetical protein